MKSLAQWLDYYECTHQNPINQTIHKVAIPGLFLSFAGIIWSIPAIPLFPLFGVSINWIWILIWPLWVFYFRLALSVFIMMLGYTLACVALIWGLEQMGLPVLALSLILCVSLWTLQLIGYRIEGKSLSWYQDLLLIFIGPIWTFRKR